MTPLVSLKSQEGFADLRQQFQSQFYDVPPETEQIGKLPEAQPKQRRLGTLHLPSSSGAAVKTPG